MDTSGGITAPAEQARGWDEEPGVEDEDIALAVPRAILLVPRLALQVAMLPVYGAIQLQKKTHVVERAEKILYFDDSHEFGWSPSLSIITSFGTTVGASVFHKSLFGNDEELKLSAKFGGRYTQFYEAHLDAEQLAHSRLWVELVTRYEADTGEVFGGIGINESDAAPPTGDPRQSNRRTYFAQERALGLFRLGYTAGAPGGLCKFGGAVILNDRAFADNRVGKPQTSGIYDTALIQGFDDGATTVELQGGFVLDGRATPGLDSRGGYLEAFSGIVHRTSRHDYGHYGVEVSYTINLYRRTRLLTLRTATEAVVGAEEAIPFSELPRLGGVDRLRGYVSGRYRDTRLALASVEYHYPIHKNVLGQLLVDTGFVSDSYRDLIHFEDWKVGYGGGFIVGDDKNVALTTQIAFGEELRFMVSTDLSQAFDRRSSLL